MDRLAAQAQEALSARRLRREAVDKAANEARGLLDCGHLDEAIQRLQEAAVTFPGESTWEPLLARALNELAARKRAEAIAKLLQDAGALAERQDFAAALNLLDRGLQTWPDEGRLREIGLSIMAAQQAWQHAEALQVAIEKVRSLGRGERYAEGLAAIDAALKEHRDDATLLELGKEFSSRQRMVKARRLIKDGRPAEALEPRHQMPFSAPGSRCPARRDRDTDCGLRENAGLFPARLIYCSGLLEARAHVG